MDKVCLKCDFRDKCEKNNVQICCLPDWYHLDDDGYIYEDPFDIL